MSLPAPAQTAPDDATEREPPTGDAAVPQTGEHSATDVETISIELNFNAFADDVPPNRHARRIAQPSDPSVQDFADQALELAALRAELKRLTRDYETLQNALRIRDMRLQALQDELAVARSGLRNTTQQLSDAQSQLASMRSNAASVAEASATPATESPASQASGIEPPETEPPETPTLELPNLSQTIPDMSALHSESKAPGRRLIPLDHLGEPVPLTRDIITIGRARGNDICIPSNGVSRDHARLLLAPRSVTIVDIGSANGCFVNDERVSKHRLRDGDVLRLGDRSYRFVDIQG